MISNTVAVRLQNDTPVIPTGQDSHIAVAADGRTITYLTRTPNRVLPPLSQFSVTATTATGTLSSTTLANGLVNENVGAEFINPNSRTAAPEVLSVRDGTVAGVTVYSTGIVASDISVSFLSPPSPNDVRTVRVTNDIGTPSYLFALDPTLTPDDSGNPGASDNEGFRVIDGSITVSWHLSYTPLGSDGNTLAIVRWLDCYC